MKKRNITLILFLCLLALIVVYMFIIAKKGIIVTNQNLPASSRNSIDINPGTFSIKTISAKCINTLPQVNLVWSQSTNANSYVIERMYPWAKSWEITGETSNLFFTDATYEPGYDLGYFTYRIRAYNSNGQTYSKSQKVNISKCLSSIPIITPNTNPAPLNTLQWGAYVGDGTNDLANFES